MKRYPLSFRGRYYNQGFTYSPIPFWRQMVVPGETANFDIEVKMVTPIFTQYLIADALVSCSLYYVPFRLVWPGFIDFIARVDGGPSQVPQNTVQWPMMFDRDSADGTTVGANYSSLMRRCYKLIYNQFFGEKPMSADYVDAWYDDILDDTDVTVKRVRNSEQYAGRMFFADMVPDPTYPVASPIPLNDFYNQMMQARSERFAKVTGDKYIDAIRRMGVELDWRVQMAPELLGAYEVGCSPTYVDATAETTGAVVVGERFSRFEKTVSLKVANKRFAEHGMIVGLAVFRPSVFIKRSQPVDGYVRTLDDFYVGDALSDWDKRDVAEALGPAGTTGGEAYTGRHSYLRSGQHVIGAGAGDWCLSIAPNTAQRALFPSPALPIVDELANSNDVAFVSRGVVSGRIPVPASPRQVIR